MACRQAGLLYPTAYQTFCHKLLAQHSSHIKLPVCSKARVLCLVVNYKRQMSKSVQHAVDD
jgi:hypothetical protein